MCWKHLTSQLTHQIGCVSLSKSTEYLGMKKLCNKRYLPAIVCYCFFFNIKIPNTIESERICMFIIFLPFSKNWYQLLQTLVVEREYCFKITYISFFVTISIFSDTPSFKWSWVFSSYHYFFWWDGYPWMCGRIWRLHSGCFGAFDSKML